MRKRANGGSGRGASRAATLTTTVTGTFTDVTGALVTSGQVRFELKPTIATVIQNQNVVEPSTVIGSISQTGQLMNQAGTGPMVVAQNTVLEPGGTYYEVSIWPEFIKTAVFNWYATQATQDLSATIPLPPVLPFIPTAITGGLIRVFMITSAGAQPAGVTGSAPGPYTYTPTANTRVLYVEAVGGGGGGGNVMATTANSAISGPGGAGGFSAAFLAVLPNYTVSVGLGGAGGALSGTLSNNGAAGGNTTFASGGTTYVQANGGSGGAGSTTPGTGPARIASIIGGLAGIGDVALPGQNGASGVVVSGSLAAAGGGGSTPWAGGSPAVVWATTGFTAGAASFGGYGSGAAGGASVGTQAAVAGGNGTGGVVRVWEFA